MPHCQPARVWLFRRTGAAALLAVQAVLASQFCQTTAAQESSAAAAPSPEQIAALEKSLSGSALVGSFTVTGGQAEQPLRLNSERYELAAVKHLDGDQWLFQARIAYGQHDVTLPLTLPVKWAGDTPVISVDAMPFPGLGTYTARVMIYRDHYAGFWAGADHGGHLFGVVERDRTNDATQGATNPTAEDAPAR